MISNKISVCGDSIMYAGNQIAFVVGDGEVCLSISSEDLENGEFPMEDRLEIASHKDEIIEAIELLGFEIVEGDEDDES